VGRVRRSVPSAFLALSLAALVACTADAGGSARGTAQEISGPLPQVSGRTLRGGTFGPPDYRGKITVVNVWATWCGPCREEQPTLQQVWRDVRDEGVTMVGINYGDDAAAAEQWVRRYEVTYPSVSDPDGAYAADLGFPGLPATYIADARGDLRYRFYGAITRESLERALGEVAAG
jgi:DsbE subfamily thiol:disulfide oxidoreductase